LKNVLGMSTASYTAVFAAGGLMISVVVSTAATQVRRFSPARQVRVGLVAQLVIDAIFCLVCVTMLRQEVSSTALLVGVVSIFDLKKANLKI
ncbi:MFS family major facilitator transporter, multidrug:cation symporter, partial [human gut metagenome]